MSDEREYIYGIVVPYRTDVPEVARVEVLKETLKRVEVRQCHEAFGYRRILKPSDVSRSPREAWEAFSTKQGRRMDRARVELASAGLYQEQARRQIEALDAAAVVEAYDESDAADEVQQQELDERG